LYQRLLGPGSLTRERLACVPWRVGLSARDGRPATSYAHENRAPSAVSACAAGRFSWALLTTSSSLQTTLLYWPGTWTVKYLAAAGGIVRPEESPSPDLPSSLLTVDCNRGMLLALSRILTRASFVPFARSDERKPPQTGVAARCSSLQGVHPATGLLGSGHRGRHALQARAFAKARPG
jgi:hypothetical protein